MSIDQLININHSIIFIFLGLNKSKKICIATRKAFWDAVYNVPTTEKMVGMLKCRNLCPQILVSFVAHNRQIN